MTSILPKFLRGAPTFPEGGFVGEGLKLDENEIPFVASQGETEVYRRQPRDARLRLELRDRLKELHAEEVSLVEEINARLVEGVQDRPPAARQFVKGRLDQTRGPLRIGVEIGPGERP